jgi:hypothetical protein
LIRLEQQKGSIRTPRQGVRIDVGEEADGAREATGGRYHLDVRKSFGADRKERDPLAIGRPHRRRRVDRVGEHSGRDQSLRPGGQIDNAQLFPVAQERDLPAVRGEHRR